MAKGIFTTRANSTYDDLPEVRYHFPKTYLRQAQDTVGDWIIYYEPRRQGVHAADRGGRQAYFATARVQRIASDPHRHDYYYKPDGKILLPADRRLRPHPQFLQYHRERIFKG